jgi:type I restriction-modification system DNA methylase subunit
MSIFQKSIINKYLKNLDNEKVNIAFKQFQKFYGDKLRLFEILHLKEENYQEGFLREIFVQSLGYTLRPDLNHNLTTEYKNQTDSKKADGAIIRNNSAIGVIELKSTKTFNLDTIKNQAFNYKNDQPDCRYVITSNFHYLRLYIDNSTEYEEFDLFEMANCTDARPCVSAEFKKLYLILSQESIFNDIPLKMKEETKFHEESISDKFYKDYKAFKDQIFENLVKNNPQYDKLTLFKKSQKLLDRFLFVYFGEDCGLCPPNSIQQIIDQWKRLQDDDIKCSLYGRFQKMFGYLDKGYKGKHFEFPGFNGGLFRPDELLDNDKTLIDDNLLLVHCPKLSVYDFNTDIDVNILGHIFEHSLNEIEEITAEIKGETIDKSKTKRKKDGVFYTPKYITNYIIENTIGKLCKDKQTELEIAEIEINETHHKNGKITKQGKELYTKLQDYKNWLLSLKILDPACGSGAFLNSALDFLIKEHQEIDDLINYLTGHEIQMFNTDKNILENNIFGVDINEESVEIAKLSLWLRTAKKDRKLSDLNNNIKCGNSLIDNKEIAGDKAFNWYKEFPQVFGEYKEDEVIIVEKPEEKPDYLKLIKETTLEAKQKAEKAIELSTEAVELTKKVYEYAEKIETIKEPNAVYKNEINNGFDVIIGNPPYVDIKALEPKIVKELFNCYSTAENRINLYSLFIEKAYRLLKKNGILSFINPNSILTNSSYFKLRSLLINDLSRIIKLPDDVFPDAKVETIIFQAQKNSNVEFTETILYKRADKITFIDNNLIVKQPKTNWKTDININYNIYSTDISSKIIEKCEKDSIQLTEIADFTLGITPYDKYKGHSKETIENRLFHSEIKLDDTYKPLITGENIVRYYLKPDIKEYIKYGDWLGAMREKRFFTEPRILIRQIVSGNPPRIFACYSDKSYYFTQIGFGIIPKPNTIEAKFLLAVINSKLINYYHKNKFLDQEKELFQKILIANCRQFPIKTSNNQAQIINKVNEIIANNEELNKLTNNFPNRLKSNFNKIKLTNILLAFYQTDFKTILTELKKQKFILKLTEQDEWEEYFNRYKFDITNLQQKINQIDKEIDKMIYELYNLTPEEVAVIEEMS